MSILDGSPEACNSSSELRQQAFAKFANDATMEVRDLHVQSGSTFQDQWHSKYFSRALPFVIPRMVSGPYFPHQTRKWRRTEEHAAVSFNSFLR